MSNKLLLTKKELKGAEYKAETDLEDIYSRHQTCRDAFDCSPLEYIEKCKLKAQLAKALPAREEIEKQERERIISELESIDRDADDVRDFTKRVCDLIVEYRQALKGEK